MLDDLMEVDAMQETQEMAGSGQARARLEQALQRLENVVGKHVERASRPVVEAADYQTLEAHCESLKAENTRLREQLKVAEESTNRATASLDAIIAQVEALLKE